VNDFISLFSDSVEFLEINIQPNELFKSFSFPNLKTLNVFSLCRFSWFESNVPKLQEICIQFKDKGFFNLPHNYQEKNLIKKLHLSSIGTIGFSFGNVPDYIDHMFPRLTELHLNFESAQNDRFWAFNQNTFADLKIVGSHHPIILTNQTNIEKIIFRFDAYRSKLFHEEGLIHCDKMSLDVDIGSAWMDIHFFENMVEMLGLARTWKSLTIRSFKTKIPDFAREYFHNEAIIMDIVE
jgi:hypothetical protein